MTDYSQYPYGRMLQYIEKRCIELGWNNRIDYVFSMEKAESMEKLIDKYNHVFQYLAILFFGTRKVPRGWYEPKSWGYKKEYLLEELNYYLNENILKWYKRLENPTNKQALSAISNLREAKNTVAVERELLSLSTPNAYNGVDTLIKNREKLYELREKLGGYSNQSLVKSEYLSRSQYLAAHEYIFDIIEISLGKDYDISYDNLIPQFKKYVETREKELEEERLKAKKIKKIKYILLTIFICSILGVLVSTFYQLNEFAAIFLVVAASSIVTLIYNAESTKCKNRKTNDVAFNQSMDVVADYTASFLLTLPFAIFGGIIGNMGKRR